MKFTLLAVLALFSLVSHAEQLTGYRVIKDIPLSAGNCLKPYPSHSYQIMRIPVNNEISITTPVTTVKAVSSFTSKKCRTSETYKLRKVGFFRNARWEEVPGSARRTSEIIQDDETTEKMKTIKDYDYDQLSVELDRLDHELSQKALSECQQKLRVFKAAITDIRNTNCR